MSKVLSLHHIVFGTKRRIPAIVHAEREHLCRIIWALLKDEKCYLYRINCVPDHVHMLIDLNATKSLSEVVGRIKSKSSNWIKSSGKYPLFDAWCDGYYAESISLAERDAVIDYIKNQQLHHADVGYEAGMKCLYKKAGLIWHDMDLY